MFLIVSGGLLGFCSCISRMGRSSSEHNTPKIVVHNPTAIQGIPSTFIVIQNPESAYAIGYLCEQKGTKQNSYRRKRMTKPQVFTTHPIT